MKDKRQKIMRGAIQGVRQLGMEGLNMKTVSRLSNTNVSIIYTLFNNKDDLLRKCFETIDRQIAGLFARIKVDPQGVRDDPEREVRRLWTVYYRYLVEHPDETMFYVGYGSTVQFAAYDKTRDRSHYAALFRIVRMFDERYHVCDRVGPELLWFHFMTNTAACVKLMLEGRLPDDAMTRETLFQLELQGLRGLLDMTRATPETNLQREEGDTEDADAARGLGGGVASAGPTVKKGGLYVSV